MMLRVVVNAKEVEKEELKKRFEAVFKKAKDIRIQTDIDIDTMMNEMNDALR